MGGGSIHFGGQGQATRWEEGADGRVHDGGVGRRDSGEGVVHEEAGPEAREVLDGVNDGEGSGVQVVCCWAQAEGVS